MSNDDQTENVILLIVHSVRVVSGRHLSLFFLFVTNIKRLVHLNEVFHIVNLNIVNHSFFLYFFIFSFAADKILQIDGFS